MLLSVVRWLRANTGLSFRIVLLGDGPLVPAFRDVAPTSVVDFHHADHLNLLERALDRGGMTRVANAMRDVRARRAVRPLLADADLLYLNTARSARVLAYLAPPLPPFVLHLHEMDFMFGDCLPGPRGTAVLEGAGAVIAASEAVRGDLTAAHRLDPAGVEVVYECIDVPDIAGRALDREGSRRRLGIAPGDAVVVGSGVLDWRKAPDLFVQLAAAVRRGSADTVRFVWVGGAPAEPLMTQLRLDARRAGLGTLLQFVPEVPDPMELLAIADVFALTAREDPFPLVCLEAAALGVPIVCFDSTGMAEFVRSDAGVVVPHLDVEAMAVAVRTLLADADLRGRMGAAAAARVKEFDTSRIAPTIADVVARLLSARPDSHSPA